jgi:ABC-type nitrate/sulfonate/bicarbonate transport system ATPase subunit/thioredoxin reductase
MNSTTESDPTSADLLSEIVVADISVRLGTRVVLERVDLRVQRGEFVCIIGPSGCGKTTLLNVMGGFVRPTSGSVWVRGERVNGPDPRRIFVFQENGVFPWLNVAENVGFGLRAKSKAERAPIVQHYLEMVGLGGFEHSYPRELSGGMRQRVEIARALAMDPDVIYMDEPFGALDHLTRLKMRHELTQIWQREQKTIVFVTHDIDEAVQLSERVVVMGSRPATCREVVTVELARPRDLDAPEAIALRRHLMRALDRATTLAPPPPALRQSFAPVQPETSHIMQEDHAQRNASTTPRYEYLIVGAGPAGLQLSYFLKRAGLQHQVLERGAEPGVFFKTFPRHRKLISINKVHTGFDDPERNLRWDWNSLLSEESAPFTARTQRYFPAADDFVDYLADYARENELPITYGFDVARIERDGAEGFRLHAKDGRVLLARRLVIATGLSKPWLPDFPGVEYCEPYTEVSVKPEDFTGQRVLILGKGNSAFETADNLIETTASIHVVSPTPLRMAWQTHFVGHLRAVNNNILDTYQLKSQNAILDAEVREIRREGNEYVVKFAYAHADGEEEALRYDRIIACTGFRFDVEPFAPECRPELKACGKLPIMTSEWESSNVDGLFFAGTLMQYRDYKRYMSGFIHGFRYNIKALTHILEQRYHGVRWPSRAVFASAADLTAALLGRANRSSALWQQPGFLCDALELNENGRSAEYLEDVPVDFAKETLLPRGEWLQLTLEFGHIEGDPFRIDRVHRMDTRQAARSLFLHPIVRHYVDGALVGEHHVIEDLAAVWTEPEHVRPLEEFVSGILLDREQGLDADARKARRVTVSGMYLPSSAEELKEMAGSTHQRTAT